ncbi:molybdopterin-guanine dinucleotide biosynthesis protein B [Candidatus Geothermarchaeota archaeon ex4572_27]|nr:MAG: molybdopterin-guanine dinucleotide biosynthesis protein B [Candidatus Geothermarchaeota archaeon ex4572_27]
MQVVAVVGPKDTYKTVLLEALIARLREAGLRVAAVKHLHHASSVDREGKDTWRLSRAGASIVVAVAGDEVAVIRRGARPSLKEVLSMLEGEVDVVLVEGFKSEVLGDEGVVKVVAAKTRDELRRLLAEARPPVFAVIGPVVGHLDEGHEPAPLSVESCADRLAKLIINGAAKRGEQVNMG